MCLDSSILSTGSRNAQRVFVLSKKEQLKNVANIFGCQVYKQIVQKDKSFNFVSELRVSFDENTLKLCCCVEKKDSV